MSPEALITETVRSLPAELVRESIAAVAGQYLALMVYGSQARGSSDIDSDVDVLAVVKEGAGAYSAGRVAITAYTPAQLHAMAQTSSLFILHLRTEGVVLEDTTGVLARVLSAYTPMKDFEAQRQQIRAAASVLNVGPDLFASHGQSLGRLGVYLLRTALYLDGAEADRLDFDIGLAAANNGDDRVMRAVALKRAPSFSEADLDLLACATASVLGCDREATLTTADELQARALHLAEAFPHASALLVNVLFGASEVDYVGLALVPW
ncbi:nucleotidyltransferase domain-containing protein [Rhodococcoides fascians]|uniref:nucleotidyltransferase domain-containing protein n=1 Tax=Rhodococcoides fascians TaxID=1828 RepID=UPI00055BB456|nr:nucleotidyltransferase domain-containing protein [Rhodococcus fascians]